MRAVALVLGGWAVVIGFILLLYGIWGSGFSDRSNDAVLAFLVSAPLVTIFGLILIFVSRRAGRR